MKRLRILFLNNCPFNKFVSLFYNSYIVVGRKLVPPGNRETGAGVQQGGFPYSKPCEARL
jgi:hypothetical protein